ncbi:MAG: alcohol dehydrogenase catalytic domain-containing protein [Verrucomicrobiota bacterium]
MKLPCVPVSDGAGEIVAVGGNVSTWKAGDRVVVPFFPDWFDGAMTRAKTAGALGAEAEGMIREFVTVRADAPAAHPGASQLRAGRHTALRGRHGLERSFRCHQPAAG